MNTSSQNLSIEEIRSHLFLGAPRTERHLTPKFFLHGYFFTGNSDIEPVSQKTVYNLVLKIACKKFSAEETTGRKKIPGIFRSLWP